MQAKYNYYAYGDELNSTVTTGTDYRYTGKELDEESGFNLYNYGARFYDARIGRFVSVDPRAEKYAGWSPYVYTLDNPIKLVDPDGQIAALAVLLAAAGAYVYGELMTPNPANAPSTPEQAVENPSTFQEVSEMASGAMIGGALPAGVKTFVKEVVAEATGVPTDLGDISKTGKVGRGMQNPKTKESVEIGQKVHKTTFSKAEAKGKGWKTEPSLKDPATGKTVRPDLVTPKGKPVEIKPRTETGKKKGATQLKAQERATGKKGRVVTYDPKKQKE